IKRVTIAESILRHGEETFYWMVGLFCLFSALALIFPCNTQPLWRKDSLTDIIYAFVMPILGRFVRLIFIGVGVFFLFHNESEADLLQYFTQGFGPLGALPIWVQAAIIFLLSDFVLYWGHRWFHKTPMWKFHAIHHSSPHVDWLSTYRFHPVNAWLT